LAAWRVLDSSALVTTIQTGQFGGTNHAAINCHMMEMEQMECLLARMDANRRAHSETNDEQNER
jgi:hypothetical protein